MIDTHTHYYLKQFDGDRFTLLHQLRKNNINRVIEAITECNAEECFFKMSANSRRIFYYQGGALL